MSGHCERTRKRNKPYHSALSVLCDCLASFEGATNVDFIGKKRVVKRSWGFSAGKRNVNYSETEEHKIKPHKLRNLRDHECVLVHCERGFRRVTLPPLESDGTVAKWFSRCRRLLS